MFKNVVKYCSIFVAVKHLLEGRGAGQAVSVQAYYSDHPSSNPTDVYSLFL